VKPSVPERPIGLLASLVVHAIRQRVAAQAEPLGLSTQQFWTIVAIAENAASSQAELAARVRVDEATACRVVRALGEAELVSAVRDSHDRRRVRLKLTSAGEALARRLLPIARQVRGIVDAALTPEERAATRAALGKVLARLASTLEAMPQGVRVPGPRAGVRGRHPVASIAHSRERLRSRNPATR
jgi:DNA-binding MarR family transcriptional regulator